MSADYSASKLPPFSLLEEPLLTFNTEDTSLDVNPLRGCSLLEFLSQSEVEVGEL